MRLLGQAGVLEAVGTCFRPLTSPLLLLLLLAESAETTMSMMEWLLLLLFLFLLLAVTKLMCDAGKFLHTHGRRHVRMMSDLSEEG